jgi:DNA polymerase IV
MPLRRLFVDFNSYFASVEQQSRPDLRNKPVGVVPVMAETTCCIAASYEAKRFGVKTGTRVCDARKMCPGIRIVEARPSLYVRYHEQLVTIVDSFLPVLQVLSIDEMTCDIAGKYERREDAIAMGLKIKAAIAAKIGPCMRSSIGIAPNTFLAKTASDMQKPDGLVVIEDRDLPHCLYKLTLRDFCGIGKNMEQRLLSSGITTAKELCNASPQDLARAWGSIDGERFHAKLHGEMIYEAETEKSSVSHSHVLEPKLRNDSDAYAVLNRLLQKAAVRLRQYEFLAGGMGLSLHYTNGGAWHQEMRFQETQDTIQFLHVFDQLWAKRPPGFAPMKVGVYLCHLTHIQNFTMPLFPEGKARPELNQLVDQINRKFGKNTVYFGGAHTALQSAPMRIAFNRIPDLETEDDD